MQIDRRHFFALTTAALSVTAHGAAGRTRTIGLLFDSLISPFWVAARERMLAEAARRGMAVLEAVSNMDDNKQYQQVQSMIQRRVDGMIIIHTNASAVVPAVRAANAARIPMVHFNRSPAPSDAYSVAVVADNRRLMYAAVSRLIEIARRDRKHAKAAILIGDLGDSNAVERRDGFEDAVAKNADFVEVVARIPTEWNADKAFAGLSNAQQAHPDIDMLVTSSDFLTPQIEQALRTAGKWKKAGEPGHVLICGFDGDERGYEKLSTGYFDVDGVQNLDFEVELTFGALEQLWSGEKPARTLLDPGLVLDRENLMTERDRMWGYAVWKAGATPKMTAAPGVTDAGIAQSSGALTSLAGVARGWTWALLLASSVAFARVLFSVDTLHDTLLAMLPLAILVAGQTMVLLIGQIDLSVTAILATSSVLSASAMARTSGLEEPWNTAAGVGISLLVGVLAGLFNGVCSAILRMPSFIVTLAVMMLGSGAAVWYVSTPSGAVSIGGLPEAFRAIGYGRVAGVPLSLILSVLVLALTWYVLSRTLAGRWIYAIGHNAKTARVSGVPVKAVTMGVFIASGLCAGIASVIYTSRVETGLATLGQSMTLDIVGAAVIGGVSLFGGRGNILMALAGVLFLSLLDKSLQLLGMSLFAVLAVKGSVILVAAIADARRTQRRERA